jgi:hypothetical protein
MLNYYCSFTFKKNNETHRVQEDRFVNWYGHGGDGICGLLREVAPHPYQQHPHGSLTRETLASTTTFK